MRCQEMKNIKYGESTVTFRLYHDTALGFLPSWWLTVSEWRGLTLGLTDRTFPGKKKKIVFKNPWQQHKIETFFP